MSRDIRSFFQLHKVKKQVVENEDDVIPESPDVQIKKKKKESRKKRIIIDDSDEEIFTSNKKKPSHPSSNNKNKTPDKPVFKEVKATDLFGSGPIKRTEPLVKKVKITETGIHSDDEFEKSLLEVDMIEEKALKEMKKDKTPFQKQDVIEVKKNDVIQVIESPVKINGDSKSQALKEMKDKSPLKKQDGIEVKNQDVIEVIESPVKMNGESKSHTHHKTKDLTSSKSKKDNKATIKNEEKSKTDKKTAISNVFDNKKEKSKEDYVTIAKKDTNNHGKHEKKKSNESIESKRIENGEGLSKTDRKRDFSEFIGTNESVNEDHDEDKHMSKKKKMDKSLNESVLTDEERHERKMHSAALYKNYLNRSGPKHLGAKQIPEGSPNCLINCAFLLTGVLDSFERDEVTEAITKYGGCVKNSMSKKVTHVLAGADAGPAKLAKAQELGIRIINEDEFLRLITELSKKKSSDKTEIKKDAKKEKSPSRKSHKSSRDGSNESKRKESRDKSREKVKVESSGRTDGVSNKRSEGNVEGKSKSSSNVDHESRNVPKAEIKSEKSSESVEMEGVQSQSSRSVAAPSAIMWVEKYKPHNVKQIIGQHGDASNVKKLINWLTKWYVNRKAKLPKPSPWAKNDDGGFYKAALLSGPPGVGKTTTVGLVCKELGFDIVEFNASDTRNKTLMKEQIGELLTTTSLAAYAKGETGKQAVTKKHVLVMDEVDGMAGNEDRGGLQELIALIKSASVPIICMCNDRNSQKMRSLVNYCYDLRFNRPRVEQIKSAMMSICCKESIKIPPDALTQLIIAANQDVRQTLNLLSMWAVDPDLTDSERLKKDANSGKKDIKLGPWEAVRKVFSAEDHKTMSINDKSDLFFYDYSLAPLFVQENYLIVAPHCPKHEVMERISKAADSISLGDLVDARIRRHQAWSLLPTQAMYSSVMPGHHMAGHVAGQIQFPGWLGKNSRAGKMHRLCQEVHAHTRLSTSGSKSSIFLDYSTHLRNAIVAPLLKDKAEGVAKSLEVLESYHLLREDLDSLTELSLWPGQRDPMILIDSKVKAAMTRTYNKTAMALPYAPGSVKRGRAREEEEGGEDMEEGGDDSDPENDALIKKKKTSSKEKSGSSKEKPGSSKEKPGSSKEKPGSSKDRPSSGKEKASTSKDKSSSSKIKKK